MSKTARRGSLTLSCSQNFLTSRRLIAHLLDIAGVDRGIEPIDIGAGKGHITMALAEQCSLVTAVELDAALYLTLTETFSGCRNVTLRRGDFLRMNLPSQTPYQVFTNIPFHMTTPILDRLTQSPPPQRRMAGYGKRRSDALLRNRRPKSAADFGIQWRCARSLRLPSPTVLPGRIFTLLPPHPCYVASAQAQGRRPAALIAHSLPRFLDHAARTGTFGPCHPLTKRQIATALRLANLPPLTPFGRSAVCAVAAFFDVICAFFKSKCGTAAASQRRHNVKKISSSSMLNQITFIKFLTFVSTYCRIKTACRTEYSARKIYLF